MALRGVRGAITVSRNARKEIIVATEELLAEMTKVNKVKVEDIASVIFTTTKDVNVAFPAEAARNLGWLYTPLLCMHEMIVPHSLRKCIRVLMHVNTGKSQKAIKHVYLGGTEKLRPDLKKKSKYYLS